MEIAKKEGVESRMAVERGKMVGLEKEKEEMENVPKANCTKEARRTKSCLKDCVWHPYQLCLCQYKL
jgi:hypothetical protein